MCRQRCGVVVCGRGAVGVEEYHALCCFLRQALFLAFVGEEAVAAWAAEGGEVEVEVEVAIEIGGVGLGE